MLVAIIWVTNMIPVIAQETAQQYFTVDEMPDLTYILPAPPDTNSVSFTNDITRYMWGKTQRLDPARLAIAINDSDYSLKYILRIFSDSFGMSITEEETPEIYRLLRDFTETCDNICVKPKNYYMRKRPFMFYHEQTATPDQDVNLAKNGSYPSGHTVFGWCAALILSEVNPEYAEDIMSRGYMYGESRVIVGAHWQSDVDAGMLGGSILFMKLHTSPAFLDQMSKARSEFIKKKNGMSTVSSVHSSTTPNQHIYNLSGFQQTKEPSKGIYIKSGKKYLSSTHY